MDKLIANYAKKPKGATIITEGSSISGELVVQGSDLHINGKVTASLFCDGDVFIASSGMFMGPFLIARKVKIAGYLKTNIQSSLVHISETGFAIAKIICTHIDISNGADVDNCYVTTGVSINLEELLTKITK